MVRVVRTFAIVMLLVTTAGCSYFRHVGKDATEVLELGVGGSLMPGFYLYAHAPLFGTALGYMADSTYVGTDYGYTWMWHQAGAGTLLGGELVRAQHGFSVEGWNRGHIVDLYAIQSQFLLLNISAIDHRTDISRLAISLTRFEIGAHVLFVGATVGVDPIELLDFVTGIFGWDMLRDDDFVPPRAPFTPEQQGQPEADPEAPRLRERRRETKPPETPEEKQERELKEEGEGNLLDPFDEDP